MIQVFKSSRARDEAILMGIGIVLVAIIAADYLSSFSNLILSSEAIKSMIVNVGIFGDLFVLGFQAVQIVIAPIPPVTPVLGGYLYGFWKSLFLITLGSFIGSYIAIKIGDKYGITVLRKFLSEDAVDKFEKYSSEKGIMPFLVIFLLPGFPDDVVCYIGGMSDVDQNKMIAAATFGRMPGIAGGSLAGKSIANGHIIEFVVILVAIIGIGYLGTKYEDRIIDWARGFETQFFRLMP